MKTFNRVIQVEVSIDTIAQNLLSTMVDSNPHREMVVEAIIGSASNHQLGLLYNSLNGYTNDINFKVGDMIVPKDIKVYGFWDGADSAESYRAILEAKIVEINVYSQDKIKIEYAYPTNKGTFSTTTKWISHIGCEHVVLSSVIDELAS
jgi:hypothetical protein